MPKVRAETKTDLVTLVVNQGSGNENIFGYINSMLVETKKICYINSQAS